jgi:hypothetical protein
MNARPIATLAAASLALFAGGCLERIETIQINPDRSARLESVFKGDRADLDSGDALPSRGALSRGGMWEVGEQAVATPGAGTEHVLRAVLEVPSGGEIPGTYASGPDGAHALKFPTSVRWERRGGDWYVHFSRVYQGRVHAPYTRAKRELESSPELKRLQGVDPDAMSPEDRRRLLEAFRRMESEKFGVFIRAGLGALTDRPQDAHLRILSGALAGARSYDLGKALELMAMAQSPERDAAIAAIADDFHRVIESGIDSALAAEGLTPREVEAFHAAIAGERRDREVTEDLGDERWEVRLTLPGEVVAHNADRVEGGVLIWSFTGESIMDADKALLASSRLPGAK